MCVDKRNTPRRPESRYERSAQGRGLGGRCIRHCIGHIASEYNFGAQASPWGDCRMTIALFLLVLFVTMTVGVPIAFALMLTALALMVHLDFFDAQLLAQNVQAGFDSFPLLAVPLFILAGELMNAGGISKRIVDLPMKLVGHTQGGLGFVAIIAAVLMASLSGSAAADTAALGMVLLPMMKNANYEEGRSAGLIAATRVSTQP